MLATLPLEKMTLEEKLITIEAIWEDIARSSPDFPSPAWHEDVLKERENLLKTGKEKLDSKTHRSLTDKFPYGVLYRIQDDHIREWQ